MKPSAPSLIALFSELLGSWEIAFQFYDYLDEENHIINFEMPLLTIAQKWNLKDTNFPHDLAQNHNIEIKRQILKQKKLVSNFGSRIY